ncbi:MAG: sulfurtransferase-like selenium metabolism protein YedF [Nitrospirae bacterium]|nr:sulfurtransferase-like selenium metabolism protein YedF [Nitrospirota bacterium]
MLIDARGLGCPKPVIMAEEELIKADEGIVEILVDNEASVENLTKFATKNGFYSETSEENTHWCVKIVKGYGCEVQSHHPKEKTSVIEEQEKDMLLIISSDVIGKEEELGRILMKGFFETMKVTKEIPHTMFFLNAGVKLTTVREEIINLLKEISSMGAEIYSCGTCLKYYNLESELKVGHRGTTNHIVEGFKDFRKVVWM